MDNVVRLSKLVKNIGLVTTAVFGVIVIATFITGHIGAGICFMPFVILGIVLILAYKKQLIVVNEDEIVFSYLIKKEQHVKYGDIRCILAVPLSDRVQFALIDKKYNRIITLDTMLKNEEVLFDALDRNGIEFVDFGVLVEQGKDVSKFVCALNWIERNYYKSVFNEGKIAQKMVKVKEKEEIEKNRKIIKIVGWLLILGDVVAYFVNGKSMMIIFIAVLLIEYALYIKYYPYIFIDVKTKRGQDVYQMPVIGAAIAFLLCLNVSKLFNYDFGSYMKFTAITTVILLIPFIIKSSRCEENQRFARKLSVAFAAFLIAFTICFPVNFLTTVDGTTHQEVVVIEKHISSGKTRDRELYVYCNGERRIYTVSRSEYESTSIGDKKRICYRKSALGLEYSTLHDW